MKPTLSFRGRWRRLALGLPTVLGLTPRGWFIPHRYAPLLPPPGAQPPYPAIERLFEDATDTFGARADAAEVEGLYAALERSLLEIGFLSADNAQHIMMSLRAVFGRSGLDERELRILRGVARQISWFAGGGDEVARRKRERGEKLR